MMQKTLVVALALAGIAAVGAPRAAHYAPARPILLHFFVRRGPGAPAHVSVQVLMPGGRAVQQLSYAYPCARWNPRARVVAFKDDVGLEACTFSRREQVFGVPRPILSVLGRRSARQRSIDLGASSLDPAWDGSGTAIVAELDATAGIESLSVATGKRHVLVPAQTLGEDAQGNTRGVDVSPEGRIVAYAVQGRDKAAPGPYDPERVFDRDPGAHCDVWLRDASGKRTRLGHGSRPRISRDGRWVVVVDRRDDRFGLDVRLYDLRRRSAPGRLVVRNAAATCFSPRPGHLLAVLRSGDLVEIDYGGRTTRRLCEARDVLRASFFHAGRRGYPIGPIMRADVDW